MRLGRRLPHAFFDRPCLEVALELVGCTIVHRPREGPAAGQLLAARLIEVEAYLGDGSDPGSHSHRGPTRRNASMFGPPARLYTYRSYGIHVCMNLVCEPATSGAAVLLRAAEPLSGQAGMAALRGLDEGAPARALCSGPGRLAQAFAIGLEQDGQDLCTGPFSVHLPPDGKGIDPDRIVRGPRVGLGKGEALPYRFHVEGHPLVSPWRPGKRSGGPR